MIQNSKTLLLTGLAALLCSCASTTVVKTTKSPDCNQPVGKIAVLAIDERNLVRQGFENRFVAQLAKAGDPAAPTYNLLSLPQIKKDKQAAANRLLADGMEVVLIVRLGDVTGTAHEAQPEVEGSVGTIGGVGDSGWFDYYSVRYTGTSYNYSSLNQHVYLETSLYDLKTEKRLWFGVTRTVVTEDMDRVAEMDPLVEKIVAAMRTDGVIR